MATSEWALKAKPDQIARVLTRRRKGAKVFPLVSFFAPWRGASLVKVVYDSRYSVFDQLDSEVDQQSKTLVGKPQVGQEHLLMDPGHGFDGLQLDDNAVFDDQVRAKAQFQPDAIPFYGNRHLTFHMQAALLQLMHHHGFVH